MIKKIAKIACLVSTALFYPITSTFAANSTPWQRLTIPNAQCGNGQPYNLFIRKGQTDKIAIAFEEGGICWSYGTCLGLLARTNLKPVETFDLSEGIFSLTRDKSAINDFTIVYFPYCTGDVYIGKHTADYKGSSVKHVGKITVTNSIQYLVDKKHLALETAQRVILTGFSAGAIGALFHVDTIEKYLPSYTHRSIVSDSPGLHFGPNFWKKFTPSQITDFNDVFNTIGIGFDVNDGVMSKRVPGYCSQYSNWNIGVMQSTHDFVMSLVFGNISPGAHFELVKGPEGIGQVTAPLSNCSAWVPSSRKHMFLNSASSSTVLAGNKTAIGYFNDLATAQVGKHTIPNYQGYSLWNYMFYPTHNQ